MANMSYCRFQNTLGDLRDCAEHLDDALSYDEKRALLGMTELMAEMLEALGYTVEAPSEEFMALLTSNQEDEED